MFQFLATTQAGCRRSFPRPLPHRITTLAISASLVIIPQFVSATRLKAESTDRPNIVLIMVDDMGFSDIGCYGGEIQTPNIDRLAAAGVRFDQFYNSGRCCPTRATLMTGLHPHQTGIGHMTLSPGKTPQDGPENYQGFLNKRCVTIAEVLRNNGYTTLMAGKWHLGMHDPSVWPLQRGYDRFFGSLAGATRFFYPEHPRGMTIGNEPIDVPESTTDEAFYTTDAFTDHALRFIDDHTTSHRSAKPFFLYLAYTAPHWPLQAFEDDIAKYRGNYQAGWEELRQQRYQRQIELGLIDSDWKLSLPSPKIPAWDSLDANKQDEMDLKMAVYAAMIDRVDQNIGKLVANLKEKRLLDHTLILFLSDNGACAEGGMLGRGNFRDVEQRNRLASNSYGEAWANASSTPLRLYKHFAHEGGTATPFFMHWPARIKKQSDWYRQPAQLIDVVPTLLDVAGAEYPQKFGGESIPPLDGISLRPAFTGEPLARDESIFIEHEGNAFVRSGKWKLVGRGVAGPVGTDQAKWELYDMAKDRTETNDLAEELPTRKARLAMKWDEWAQRVGVYPKPGTKKQTRKKASRVQASQVLRDSRDNVTGLSSAKQANVLFIARDDLNDWIGCLGGHPQTITPNLDRLAANGVLFANAHCPAPACNPCRSAIFTARAPNRSGLYDNRQQMREVMPNEVLLPQYFRAHGYHAAGSGKLLNYFIDAKSWDDYFPDAESENPLPETFYPKQRPVNLPTGAAVPLNFSGWTARANRNRTESSLPPGASNQTRTTREPDR